MKRLPIAPLKIDNLLLLFLALLALPIQPLSAQWPEQEDQSIVTAFLLPPVSVRIFAEPKASQTGYYTLSWINPFTEARERELHVYVRDSTGTIGRYTGHYEPQTTLSFHTTAREVEVFFLPRLIPYASGEASREWVCNFGEYKSIRLPLDGSFPQLIRLRSRKDVVGLQFISRYAMIPDEMPCSGCCEIDGVLVLSRYYISLKTGKILKGRQWLNRRPVEKLVGELELYPIDPAAQFMDKSGKIHSGAALIADKKVDLGQFGPNHFSSQAHTGPY